jgi:hypothetical protein
MGELPGWLIGAGAALGGVAVSIMGWLLRRSVENLDGRFSDQAAQLARIEAKQDAFAGKAQLLELDRRMDDVERRDQARAVSFAETRRDFAHLEGRVGRLEESGLCPIIPPRSSPPSRGGGT